MDADDFKLEQAKPGGTVSDEQLVELLEKNLGNFLVPDWQEREETNVDPEQPAAQGKRRS
jgi:hypothetical protein